jgi:hypothetical protein
VNGIGMRKMFGQQKPLANGLFTSGAELLFQGI